MGGAAKHMRHIWENLDFSFNDIVDIMLSLSNGVIRPYEKVDGINMFVGVDVDGNVKFARSPTQIIARGKTLETIKKEFEGHPAEVQFVEGCKAIYNFIMANEWNILGITPSVWLNCEIIYSESPQLLKYDENSIVFHGVKRFKVDHGKLQELDASIYIDNFIEFCDNVGGQVINDWTAMGPIEAEINKYFECDDVIDALEDLLVRYELNFDNTLRDFLYKVLLEEGGAVESLPISLKRKEKLAEKICDIENHRLVDIKKGLSAGIGKIVSSVGAKKEEKKIRNDSMKEVKNILNHFYFKLMKDCHSQLTNTPLEKRDNLLAELKDATNLIYSTNDGFRRQRVILYNKHSDALQNQEFPYIEGIVFLYNGHQLKLTGAFASINQVIGLLRYGRGKIPKIGENNINPSLYARL